MYDNTTDENNGSDKQVSRVIVRRRLVYERRDSKRAGIKHRSLPEGVTVRISGSDRASADGLEPQAESLCETEQTPLPTPDSEAAALEHSFAQRSCGESPVSETEQTAEFASRSKQSYIPARKLVYKRRSDKAIVGAAEADIVVLAEEGCDEPADLPNAAASEEEPGFIKALAVRAAAWLRSILPEKPEHTPQSPQGTEPDAQETAPVDAAQPEEQEAERTSGQEMPEFSAGQDLSSTTDGSAAQTIGTDDVEQSAGGDTAKEIPDKQSDAEAEPVCGEVSTAEPAPDDTSRGEAVTKPADDETPLPSDGISDASRSEQPTDGFGGEAEADQPKPVISSSRTGFFGELFDHVGALLSRQKRTAEPAPDVEEPQAGTDVPDAGSDQAAVSAPTTGIGDIQSVDESAANAYGEPSDVAESLEPSIGITILSADEDAVQQDEKSADEAETKPAQIDDELPIDQPEDAISDDGFRESSEDTPAPDQESGKTVVELQDGTPIDLTEIAAIPPKSKRIWRRVAAVMAALVAVALICTGGYFYHLSNILPEIGRVAVSDELNEDLTVTLSMSVSSAPVLRADTWAYLSDSNTVPEAGDAGWVQTQNGECSFDVHAGDYHLFAMDARGNISASVSRTVEINEILGIETNTSNVYLAIGGHEQLSSSISFIGEVDETVEWLSSDDSIATVTADGLVTGVGEGTVTISARASSGLSADVEVIVTSLIQTMQIIENKTVLPANRYTHEEAHLLDEMLYDRIEKAGGYGTRGAVVAAIRFLTLEFPYRISYFFENGRMTNDTNRPVCDGEGRYYHRGLYLCDCKFEDLRASRWGPAYWGQLLLNWETDYHFVAGNRYQNGLDCSGFVTWCVLNGGFDVGDVGSGDTWRDDDLCDLGERVNITPELMSSGRVKAGDLIGKDGHIAIIAGIDDKNIYIAESLPRGVVISTYTLDRGIYYSYQHDYIMLMDEVYKQEGIYTNMWETPALEQ